MGAVEVTTVNVSAKSSRSAPAEGIKAQWWMCEDSRVHEALVPVVEAIEQAQSYRSRTNLRHARLYGGAEYTGFGPGQIGRVAPSGPESRLALNVIRSCVETAASKIAKNKPRARFLTTNGDWSLQDRAKLLTQYVDGLFDACGIYDVAQRVFVDACVFGTGAMKIYVDDSKIHVERVFIDDVIVDEQEGVYGQPRQISQRTWIARERLIEMFPEHAEAIRLHTPENRGKADAFAADQLRVYESWHLPSGSTKDEDGKPRKHDGRHAIAIKGLTLFAEPYANEWFPIIFMRWAPSLMGFFGTGIAEELTGIQWEINKLLRTIQEAQHLACVPRVFIDVTTEVTRDLDNEIGGHYRFAGRPPVISTAPAMPPEVYQHLENLFRKGFEVVGVSQMAAGSKKDPGVTAAVAMREANDIQTERFSLVGQRHEAFFVEAARIMVALTRDIAESEKGLSVLAKAGKFIERIDWKDAALEDDAYVLRVFPVSSLPSTPQGRLQFISELVEKQFITDKAQALSLLDFQDLDAFISTETAAYDDVRMILENILSKGKYEAPDKFMNHKLALSMCQSAILRARADGRPQARIDLLVQWSDEVDAWIQKLTPPPAPPAPMGGPPMPMGGPPLPPDLGAPVAA